MVQPPAKCYTLAVFGARWTTVLGLLKQCTIADRFICKSHLQQSKEIRWKPIFLPNRFSISLTKLELVLFHLGKYDDSGEAGKSLLILVYQELRISSELG